MPDNHALGQPEGIEHAHDISDELALGVGFDRLRRVSFTIAALIGRNGAKSRLSEGMHLMAPGVPQLGKAVAHYDRVALSGFGHMHPNSIRGDLLMPEITHVR